MLRKNARTWLAALAACSFALGCGPSSASRTFPPDPLFLSKHPVKGKGDPKPTIEVAEAPTPPNSPSTGLAERRDDLIAPSDGTFMQDRKSRQEKVTPATPASRIKPSRTPDAPAETSASIYGHAPDYSWIRGVLDKHYHGYMNIRYCDLSMDDPHGGKFTLEEDRRLTTFRDGDVVTIEGELLSVKEGTDPSPWNPFRTYKIRTIRFEQRPNE